MNPVTQQQIVAQLGWRYATKCFDAGRSIEPATWETLERALVLTPSSFGMQPWHFLVLVDRALRERLVPHAWGQRQIVDCSHFVVFCARLNVGEAEIDQLIRRTAEVRGGAPEALSGFRRMLMGTLVHGSFRETINEWATRQVYIALGNFMTSAALLGVDTCPMEGYEPARFDEILDLRRRGLTASVCCAAGYRAAQDRHAALPKVRYPDDLLIERR